MTPEDHKSLAQQLDANPLWHEIMQRVEDAALEGLVRADTDQARLEEQTKVRAVRTMRADCQRHLGSTPPRKVSTA